MGWEYLREPKRGQAELEAKYTVEP